MADCQAEQEIESASSMLTPGLLSEDDSTVEDLEASGSELGELWAQQEEGSVVEPAAAEEEVTEGSWLPSAGWIDWYMECGDEEEVSQRPRCV